MHRECFACAGRADNCQIRIFVDPGIENIHDHKAVIVLVDTQKHTILVRHFIGCEWIAAGSCGGQDVPLASFKEFSVEIAERHARAHGVFLTESAYPEIHILRDHEPFYLCHTPFQILQRICCDGHKDIHVVEVLVVGQALFEVVSRTNGALNIIEVRIGVRGIFDAAPIDSDLLAELRLDALFRLALEIEINIDSLTCIDQQRGPACHHAGVKSIGRNHQIGMIQSIHDRIGSMLEIDALRSNDGWNRQFCFRRMSCLVYLGLLDALFYRDGFTCLPIENCV